MEARKMAFKRGGAADARASRNVAALDLSKSAREETLNAKRVAVAALIEATARKAASDAEQLFHAGAQLPEPSVVHPTTS